MQERSVHESAGFGESSSNEHNYKFSRCCFL